MEKHFYDKKNYDDQFEVDAYDQHSLHFAAFDKGGKRKKKKVFPDDVPYTAWIMEVNAPIW